MNTYSVETINGETTHKIAIPWDVDESNLTQVKEYVDKLRKNYPDQHWVIYEHIKQVLDY